MRGTSVSTGQMTMIAYPRVVWCERFFAYATVYCWTFLNCLAWNRPWIR